MIIKARTRELYRIINMVLFAMRFKAHYRGFFYIREILLLLLLDEKGNDAEEIRDIKDIVPKALYIDVSKKLSVSIENIEKSIRVAIQKMWETAQPGLETELCGEKYTFPQTKPTNTQTIYSSYLLVKAIMKKEEQL